MIQKHSNIDNPKENYHYFERIRNQEFDKDNWIFREEVSKDYMAKVAVKFKGMLDEVTERLKIEELIVEVETAQGD